MNELTNIISGEFVPKQAIVVYQFDSNYYLEIHDMEDGKLLSGKPLTEDQMSDLAEYLSNNQKERDHLKGVIPENVIYADWSAEKRVLVWYRLAEMRMMHFTRDLKIPSGMANQPDLLYVLENGELRIFAMHAYLSNHRSGLCVPPYHNCSHSGSVCLGSAKIKKPKANTYKAIMEHYENLFWNSEFSHLAENESNIYFNLHRYWRKAVINGQDFDLDLLKPIKGLTIENLLAEL